MPQLNTALMSAASRRDGCQGRAGLQDSPPREGPFSLTSTPKTVAAAARDTTTATQSAAPSVLLAALHTQPQQPRARARQRGGQCFPFEWVSLAFEQLQQVFVVTPAAHGFRGAPPKVKRTTLVDSRTSVTDVKFAPKHMGLMLATCSADGIVRVYEAPDVMNLSQWSLQHEISCKLSCSCISWNPSSSRAHPPMIAVGSDDSSPNAMAKAQIFEYNENTRKELTSSGGPTKFEIHIVAQFDNHNSQVWRVSWNITGTVLASSGDDGCVRLWKANYMDNWKCTGILKGNGSPVSGSSQQGSSNPPLGSNVPNLQNSLNGSSAGRSSVSKTKNRTESQRLSDVVLREPAFQSDAAGADEGPARVAEPFQSRRPFDGASPLQQVRDDDIDDEEFYDDHLEAYFEQLAIPGMIYEDLEGQEPPEVCFTLPTSGPSQESAREEVLVKTLGAANAKLNPVYFHDTSARKEDFDLVDPLKPEAGSPHQSKHLTAEAETALPTDGCSDPETREVSAQENVHVAALKPVRDDGVSSADALWPPAGEWRTCEYYESFGKSKDHTDPPQSVVYQNEEGRWVTDLAYYTSFNKEDVNASLSNELNEDFRSGCKCVSTHCPKLLSDTFFVDSKPQRHKGSGGDSVLRVSTIAAAIADASASADPSQLAAMIRALSNKTREKTFQEHDTWKGCPTKSGFLPRELERSGGSSTLDMEKYLRKTEVSGCEGGLETLSRAGVSDIWDLSLPRERTPHNIRAVDGGAAGASVWGLEANTAAAFCGGNRGDESQMSLRTVEAMSSVLTSTGERGGAGAHVKTRSADCRSPGTGDGERVALGPVPTSSSYSLVRSPRVASLWLSEERKDSRRGGQEPTQRECGSEMSTGGKHVACGNPYLVSPGRVTSPGHVGVQNPPPEHGGRGSEDDQDSFRPSTSPLSHSSPGEASGTSVSGYALESFAAAAHPQKPACERESSQLTCPQASVTRLTYVSEPERSTCPSMASERGLEGHKVLADGLTRRHVQHSFVRGLFGISGDGETGNDDSDVTNELSTTIVQCSPVPSEAQAEDVLREDSLFQSRGKRALPYIIQKNVDTGKVTETTSLSSNPEDVKPNLRWSGELASKSEDRSETSAVGLTSDPSESDQSSLARLSSSGPSLPAVPAVPRLPTPCQGSVDRGEGIASEGTSATGSALSCRGPHQVASGDQCGPIPCTVALASAPEMHSMPLPVPTAPAQSPSTAAPCAQQCLDALPSAGTAAPPWGGAASTVACGSSGSCPHCAPPGERIPNPICLGRDTGSGFMGTSSLCHPCSSTFSQNLLSTAKPFPVRSVGPRCGVGLWDSGVMSGFGPARLPEALGFPHACCVGIASQTLLSVLNPGDRWLQASVRVLSVSVDGEKIETEKKDVLDFGDLAHGGWRALPLKLVNRTHAAVPVRLVISANATAWRCFTFSREPVHAASGALPYATVIAQLAAPSVVTHMMPASYDGQTMHLFASVASSAKQCLPLKNAGNIDVYLDIEDRLASEEAWAVQPEHLILVASSYTAQTRPGRRQHTRPRPPVPAPGPREAELPPGPFPQHMPHPRELIWHVASWALDTDTGGQSRHTARDLAKTGRFQIVNNCVRLLRFELHWPAHCLTVTPPHGFVAPESKLQILVSPNFSFSMKQSVFPWSGFVYVHCDSGQKVSITFLPRDRGDYAQFWDVECHPLKEPHLKHTLRFQLCGQSIPAESEPERARVSAHTLVKVDNLAKARRRAVSEASAPIPGRQLDLTHRGVYAPEDVYQFLPTRVGESRTLKVNLRNNSFITHSPQSPGVLCGDVGAAGGAGGYSSETGYWCHPGSTGEDRPPALRPSPARPLALTPREWEGIRFQGRDFPHNPFSRDTEGKGLRLNTARSSPPAALLQALVPPVGPSGRDVCPDDPRPATSPVLTKAALLRTETGLRGPLACLESGCIRTDAE
ncbi:hypothetical protein CB1_000932083 [Camelus ferus]|nr:hypothetical protein CB1_000932083 [Camelus ferus]